MAGRKVENEDKQQQRSGLKSKKVKQENGYYLTIIQIKYLL